MTFDDGKHPLGIDLHWHIRDDNWHRLDHATAADRGTVAYVIAWVCYVSGGQVAVMLATMIARAPCVEQTG